MTPGSTEARASGEDGLGDASGFRAAVLRVHGADGDEIPELLRYTRRRFDDVRPGELPPLPLPDEPFVATWEGYVADVEDGRRPLEVLREDLVQLRFPVTEGMSGHPVYTAAVRKGVLPGSGVVGGGLELERPDELRVEIRRTPAGGLPFLLPACREDFRRILRAVVHQNEPVPIPDAVGATIVSGYNNWGRVRAHRHRWERNGGGEGDGSWAEEFRRLRERKELYQDRFVVASPGRYSGVPAGDLGLEPGAWRETSVRLRVAHEAAHYVTRRLLGAMGNFLHDELIADYAGIVTVRGEFRGDWFLRFMGLRGHPRFRRDGRLAAYRGEPELSEGAFRVLRSMVVSAARNLEEAKGAWNAPFRGPADRARRLAALAGLALEEIAAPDGARRLEAALPGEGPEGSHDAPCSI